MKAWLLYEREDSIRNIHYIHEFKMEGQAHGIWFQLILTEDLDFGVQNGVLFITYRGEEIELPDFAVCRTRYPLLTIHLEWMGIPTFNNSQVAEICNDKARTYQYVAQTGIKVADTIFCNKNLWENKKEALFEKGNLPFVLKSVTGHGGKQVFLIETEKEYEQAVLKCDGEDFVMQPLLGNRNQDLRVYVLGNEIIAAVLRTGKEGFRSNYSLGGDIALYSLSEEETEIVNKIIDIFEFDLVGIDFIIGDDNALIFNEIEDVVGSRMLYECKNVNIPGLYIEYIINKIP